MTTNVIEEKLKWYVYEATPEEFDEREVERLIKELNLKESLLSKAECLELNVEDTEERTQVHTKTRIRTIGAITGFVAAAALLAITVIGISNKPVVADPDTGFFHVLSKDEKGREFIGNPTAVMGQQLPSTINSSPAKDQDDVAPEDSQFFKDLKSIFFIPPEIPGDLIMTSYEGVHLPGVVTRFHSHYENDYGTNMSDYRYVVIGLSSRTTISNSLKLSGSKQIAGLEVYHYIGKYGGGHNLIFGDGSVIYYVDGNIDLSDLEDIMKQYIEFMRKNGVI